MMKRNKLSRRNFLRNASVACMGFGLSHSLSSMNNLRALNSMLSSKPPFSDYKAMVYFFLHGGNDGFNMLMPRSGTAYTDYQNTRTNMALNSSNMISIESGNYGMHPSLSDLGNLYNNNDLAFLTNIGSLIEPITKTQYNSGVGNLPLGLYSHSDQFKHWQTGKPHLRTNIGWGGEISDLIGFNNVNDKISMNISLSGSNIFQYGANSIEFSINQDGAVKPDHWDASWGYHPERRAATDSILKATYTDMYRKTYADIFKGSIEAAEEFEDALSGITFSTQFSDHYTSQNFEMIAKTIKAVDNGDLDFQRQIFFVKYGGWDHHNDLLNGQQNNLTNVNNAVKEFNEVLKEMGLYDKVVTFVISEFGRRLTSNGNGTDHAWGSNVMLMGGKVNNGMFGTYPSLAINSDQYVHNGALIPTTATDSMFSELALWFGVNQSDLVGLFPNLGNFHDVNAISTANPPIGFMDFS